MCGLVVSIDVPVKIGRQEIQLRHTTPRTFAAAGRLSGLLRQAFRHLGREHITPKRMAHLKRTLPAKERKQLIKDIPFAPAWMHRSFENSLKVKHEVGNLQSHCAKIKPRLSREVARRDICAVLIEKDFWRSWTLAALFAHPKFSHQLVFKGGTSLSKGFRVIERFSEDIDLSVTPDSWRSKKMVEEAHVRNQ